jgi:ferredoxin hydrogenase
MSKDIRVAIDLDNPSIQRIEERCIMCSNCKEICTNYISVHNTYDLEKTGNRAACIYCGQCANVCPVDCIVDKYEYQDVKKAISDPTKIVIVSTSPSVRASLGEEFSMKDGSFVQGKIVSLLKKLGVNYVLDTNFGADMTIMEEASELIERITNKNAPLPQFTSCCPAWVRFAEMYYPEILPNISTTKSPIGIQGPTIKTYFAKKMNIDPKKIVNVALTPCTAKKFEIRREEMCASGKYHNDKNMRDMDYVITTREIAIWAKEEGIDFNSLEDSKCDDFMGEASGAGVIFGNTGGVMEAALRTSYNFLTKKNTPSNFLNLTPVRGYDGIREATVKIENLELNVAVVYGTNNVRKVIDLVKSGKKTYHFIEVMTCPGGCIGGGGQPKNFIKDRDEIRKARINSLYNKDNSMEIRNSHDNPSIKKVYEEFYQRPLSELAEQLLHTHYKDASDFFTKK